MQSDGVFSLLGAGGSRLSPPGETAPVPAPAPGHGPNVDTLHIVTL